MKTISNSVRVACQLALVQASLAAPLAPRNETAGFPNKSILLWAEANSQLYTSGMTELKTSITEATSKVQAISNWSPQAPPEAPSDTPFYPMVRIVSQLQGTDLSNLQQSIENEVAAGRTPIVQFLNEPELDGTETLTSALGAWRNGMLPLRKEYGAKLVGVSTSSSDAGIAYQKSFMGELADDEKPDYVGVHYYTNSAESAETSLAWVKGYLNDAHTNFDKQLFINEIGSTSSDPSVVSDFSDQIKTWMDDAAQDWIVQYGFFGATLLPAVAGFNSEEAQMLNSDGSWTDLGKDLLGL